MAHVLSHVCSHNVIPVHLGVEVLSLRIVPGESLHREGNVQAAVDGALHRGEDASPRGGAIETAIQITSTILKQLVYRQNKN